MSKPELPIASHSDVSSSDSLPPATKIMERLELLAEKAEVTIDRHLTGQLLVKKVVRQQTIQIPVLLTEEVLVIEYQQSTHTTALEGLERPAESTHIVISGETITLHDKQMIEIPLYHEQAEVHKKVVVTEQVDIGKTTKQHQLQQSVVLQHEELDVQERQFE